MGGRQAASVFRLPTWGKMTHFTVSGGSQGMLPGVEVGTLLEIISRKLLALMPLFPGWGSSDLLYSSPPLLEAASPLSHGFEGKTIDCTPIVT